MKKIILTILFFIVLVPNALCALEVDKVPNPMSTNGGFVVDEGRVLGSEYVQLLNDLSSEIKKIGNAELAIVTVDNMAGLPAEEYSVALFERFKIGDKKKDDGILILFSRDDRKIRVEVGYGLEGTFNDALVGRLLDENTIPNFKNGEFGKGIYLLAKVIGEKIAKMQNKEFTIPVLFQFPPQVALPAPEKSSNEQTKPGNLNDALLGYAIVMAFLTLFNLVWLSIRVHSKKGKAPREKILDDPMILPWLQWFGGAIYVFVVGGMNESYFLPAVVFIVCSIGTTMLAIYTRRFMKRRLQHYKLPCSQCSKPMRLISEQEDDKLLSPEEIAEELAEGMNYEFWICDACQKTQRFNVRVGKASKCPKCKRLSLKQEEKILQKETEHQAGKKRVTRTCLNVACGFSDEEEVSIPKKSSGNSSDSSDSSDSSSGGGSFGGGSSGGGGASRGW